MSSKPNVSGDANDDLLADFEALWAEGQEIWDQNHESHAFHGYVSADYPAVYQMLVELRDSALTMLEWGSGLGIVTIMASRMGFDAYGIEAEPRLLMYAEELADKYGADARFAQGSFIPDDFIWTPADGSDIGRTIIDTPDAYDELDMHLKDFDLVYAYPWPDEHDLYHNIIREFGRRDTILLTYDAREAMALTRFDKK